MQHTVPMLAALAPVQVAHLDHIAVAAAVMQAAEHRMAAAAVMLVVVDTLAADTGKF
jgi:hypothetical protein